MSAFTVVNTVVGDINGVNTDFTTPTDYTSGTLRAVINGITYPVDDDQYGITELTSNSFRLNLAPKTGFNVQALYSEIAVVGSPFDPDGVLP